ncbi:MAG: hypothetical protein AB1444_03465 [Spirochaetota bacterium]
MINTFEIYQNLKETFGEKEATVLTNLLIKIYNEINQSVTKEEFRVLTENVVELSEAQRRTEQRVEELAEAQKRTEQRVEELAEAQKRTEQRVEELAEAQKRTEDVLKNLILTVDDLKKQVGGLSMVVGYGIEDNLIPYIENFVYNQYGAEAKEVERKYIQYDSGKYDEVNIYVKAVKNDKDVYIIGECKAQPGKRDIDRFAKMLERLRVYLQSDVIGFMVGYTIHPEIEEYCKMNYNINAFKTYQVKRIAQKK